MGSAPNLNVSTLTGSCDAAPVGGGRQSHHRAGSPIRALRHSVGAQKAPSATRARLGVHAAAGTRLCSGHGLAQRG